MFHDIPTLFCEAVIFMRSISSLMISELLKSKITKASKISYVIATTPLDGIHEVVPGAHPKRIQGSSLADIFVGSL